MIDSDQYCELSQEYRDVCEEQRRIARIASDFDRAGCPLLAESWHVEARALSARIFELLPQLQEYEKRRGGFA